VLTLSLDQNPQIRNLGSRITSDRWTIHRYHASTRTRPTRPEGVPQQDSTLNSGNENSTSPGEEVEIDFFAGSITLY